MRSFFPAAPDSNTSGSAAISGTVFADRNDNGVRDPNEPGVAGVKVTLTGTDSTGHKVSLVTTTATGGGYAFPGLNPGTYTVTENTPTGYLNDKVSPPARTITLVAGQTATPTFGILPPSTLAGTVYLDAGNTGVIEPNDFGIAHVTVTLTGTNDLGQKIDLSTTTDANGNYEFNGLRPGVYTVTRGASPLFNNGSADVGTMGGAAQGLQINGVSLIGGESAAQYDFGQKIKPTCVLATPAFKTILAQGPHPTGPSSSSSTAKVCAPRQDVPESRVLGADPRRAPRHQELSRAVAVLAVDPPSPIASSEDAVGVFASGAGWLSAKRQAMPRPFRSVDTQAVAPRLPSLPLPQSARLLPSRGKTERIRWHLAGRSTTIVPEGSRRLSRRRSLANTIPRGERSDGAARGTAGRNAGAAQ